MIEEEKCTPIKADATPLKEQSSQTTEKKSENRAQIADTPKLFYYNSCPNCHKQHPRNIEYDEEQNINIASLFSCPDVTKCSCILDTPPLKRKLKLEGGIQNTSSMGKISREERMTEMTSSQKKDFSFRSPSTARVLNAFTSTYLSPAPYPFVTFESPAR